MTPTKTEASTIQVSCTSFLFFSADWLSTSVMSGTVKCSFMSADSSRRSFSDKTSNVVVVSSFIIRSVFRFTADTSTCAATVKKKAATKIAKNETATKMFRVNSATLSRLRRLPDCISKVS